MRPGAAVLAMDVPVVLDDRIDLQQTVGAGFLDPVRHARQQAIALDAAVDDDMRHMDALRAEFTRHRLDQQAQARGIEPQVVYDEFSSLNVLNSRNSPEDIAGAVTFFCSDMARAVTGQALYVNSGETFH